MGLVLPGLTPADGRSAIAGLRPLDDPETCLLLHCGRADVEPERAAQVRALVDAGLDWDRVLALAARHGLRALLHRHLTRLAPDGIPAAPLAVLRDYAQKNSAFGLLFTGELLRLLAALDADGVEAVPFKGPALAQALYGHLALRQFCDLDILVREADVWRASRSSKRTASSPTPRSPPAGVPRSPGRITSACSGATAAARSSSCTGPSPRDRSRCASTPTRCGGASRRWSCRAGRCACPPTRTCC